MNMDRASHSLWNAKDVARLLALVESERRYFAEITADLPVPVAIVSPELDLLLTNRAFQAHFRLKRRDTHPHRLTDLASGAAMAARAQTAFATRLPLERVEAGGLRISVVPFRAAEDPGQELLLVIHPAEHPVAPPLEGADFDAVFWRRGGQLEFVSVSQQVEELLGYTPQHYLSDAGFWLSTVHSADRDGVDAFYRNIHSDGRYHVEYRVSDSRGNALRMRDVIRVRGGQMSGMTLDVTQRGLIEDDNLQSEKFEALSRLARRVTHDFNNLHMVIKGYGDEVLNALPVDGTSHGDMEEILGAAGRLAMAVEKLDIYIRRPSLQCASFDLNQFAERLSRGSGIPHAVEVHLALDPAAAPVQGDAENLEKIVNWLFTLDAGGHARISTNTLRAEEYHADKPNALKSGRYSVLEVANSGPKLDPAVAEPVLLRAHTVMHMMGGGFAYFSDARGNRFCLFLPAATGAVAAAEEPSTGSPGAPKTRTVLVVEDEPGIRALIRKMLLRRGYQVLEAPSGLEGLQTVNKHGGKIDLLITDLMMPQMNGRELVDRLAVSWPQIRVVFISGFTEDPLLDRNALPAGVVFLQKPFTLESLLEKVDQALGPAA
jgi:two-component system cell cycle sensor histidine kinase/response regulator CckA